MTYQYIRFFNEIGINDISQVGGKNASLGEMVQKLVPEGVKVPNGFAITAQSYRYLLDENDAWDDLRVAMANIDPLDVKHLAKSGKRAREIIYGAQLPDDLKNEIIAAYHKLQEQYGEDLSLVVRSSATAEDLPTASFAGQQDTYLNIHGEETLLDACLRCFLVCLPTVPSITE